MIGKIRESRTTLSHLIVPKGYRTRDLLSRQAAKNWKNQLKLNHSIIEVLNRRKLDQEVDDMLDF